MKSRRQIIKGLLGLLALIPCRKAEAKKTRSLPGARGVVNSEGLITIGNFWGLTFTAEEPNSLVCLTNIGAAPSVSLVYSTTGGIKWKPYTINEEITLKKVGDSVCFAAAPGVTNGAFASSHTVYNNFYVDGLVAASGDISSLIRNDETTAKTLTLASYQFDGLFRDCSLLTSAPSLPATNLGAYCYYNMFNSCESLSVAPDLPATNCPTYAYYGMFKYCYALTTPPVISATIVAARSFGYMFGDCISLVTAPTINVTTLNTYCFMAMFRGCTALTNPPALPLMTMTTSCYRMMFYGCTSLVRAPELPATTLVSTCYYWMFYGCTALNYIKVGFSAFNPTNATTGWVINVPASGTFECPTALGTNDTITRGNANCPTGWTVVNV